MNTTPIVLPDDYGLHSVGLHRLCTYCRQPVGSPHGHDCVVVRRVIRPTLVLQVWGSLCIVHDFVDLKPASWNAQQISFSYNESSSCLDNVLSWVALVTRDKLVGRFTEELDRANQCSCSIGYVHLEEGWRTEEVVPQNLSSEMWRQRYLQRQGYSS